MKRKLAILFISLATIAATIIGGFHYYSAQKEAQYKQTAVPYVKRVIPELSKWDPEITRKYLSAQAKEKYSDDVFNRTIEALSAIGTLQEMGEPQFEEIYSSNRETVISYTVKTKYSKGDAIFTLSLLDSDGNIEVDTFYVQSQALAR